MTFNSYWEMFQDLDEAHQNRFVDYCMGDEVDPLWATTGSGTVARVDTQDVGYQTTATANNIALYFNSINAFDYQNCGFICNYQRVADTNHSNSLGMSNNGLTSDYIFADADTAQTYWRLITHNTASNATDSTVTRDTNQHIHSFEVGVSSCVYKIDGTTEVTTSTQLPNTFLEPYIYSNSSSGTNNTYINYVEAYGTA